MLPRRLARRRRAGDAEHGQATSRAGEQAARQVAVPRVVPEREGGVARELRPGAVPGLLVDQRRHGDGDPLLARFEPAAVGAGARAAPGARLGRRDVGVAVGVGRAGVDRVGEDVVHRGRRPGVAARARQVRAGVQALEDLADGRSLVDEPAVEHPRRLDLVLVHHKVARHGVPARHVAVAVGGTTAEVAAVAGALELAAAEALAEDGTLVLGDGALDLQPARSPSTGSPPRASPRRPARASSPPQPALRPAGRDRGVERVPIPASRRRPDAVVAMDDPAAREAGKVQAALRAAGIVSRHLPSCPPDPNPTGPCRSELKGRPRPGARRDHRPGRPGLVPPRRLPSSRLTRRALSGRYDTGFAR